MRTYKQKLAYIALGGVLMLIGMIASNVFLPSLFAQRDKFGEIECTSLRVVDARGKTQVRLIASEHHAPIAVFNKNGELCVGIGTDVQGGAVILYDKDYNKGDKSTASLFINEHGGVVHIKGKRDASAQLNIDEHGAGLVISGHYDSKGNVSIGINEKGNGVMSTYDKNGNRLK